MKRDSLPFLFSQPADEFFYIDPLDRTFQIPTIDDSQDHNFLTFGKEDRSPVAGLDLPIVGSSELLDLARRPWRLLEDFNVIEDLQNLFFGNLAKISFGSWCIEDSSLIHGACSSFFSSSHGQCRPYACIPDRRGQVQGGALDDEQ